MDPDNVPLVEKKPIILYSLIARDSFILCDGWAPQVLQQGIHNAPAITAQLISKANTTPNKSIGFTVGSYTFLFWRFDGLLFMVLIEVGYSTRKAALCINDIKDRFFATNSASTSRFSTSSAGEFAHFSRQLVECIKLWNSNQAPDVYSQTEEAIEQTKIVMIHNLELLIEREQSIRELQKSSSDLNFNSFVYKKEAAAATRRLIWKNYRYMFLIAILVCCICFFLIVIAIIAVLVACKGTLTCS
eukprot:TRINITY_DN26238_c0_g1_i1.p1 TRINITY_DN26238_c0_g1~~TRINITY_DN26238_c0_g1_i1.p1  ORF type:complete len:255 (+),score=14.10 TRINITY_DN26238_c0_g1_i1:32-766(+)